MLRATRSRSKTLCLAALFCSTAALGQAKPPSADLITFVNGEQLSGHLVRADGRGVVFKSDMAGEISVAWDRVKELKSDGAFALLSKEHKLTLRSIRDTATLGKVTVNDQQIQVLTREGTVKLPTSDADRLISAEAFEKAVDNQPPLYAGYTGTVTGGFSLVRATLNTTAFNGAVALVRAVPTVDWLASNTRTSIDYTQSYSTTSQPGTATIESNIFHADAERDSYFSPRVFIFGSTAFDHNFSQSLALQQSYGGGAGITLLKSNTRELDFKADLHYESQGFFDETQNLKLLGSTFAETYTRHAPRGIVLTEAASVSPTWNVLRAFSAHGSASVTLPVFKSLGFSLGVVEDYLNNSPANSNSIQYTTGLTYTLK